MLAIFSLLHQAKMRALNRKQCIVDCFFEGVATQALWDTGSKVTIINESWRKTNLPHIRLIDRFILINCWVRMKLLLVKQ